VFFVTISVIRSVIQALERAFCGTDSPRSPGPAKSSETRAGAPELGLRHIRGSQQFVAEDLRWKVFHFSRKSAATGYVA
jgi:hypothetical protein